MSMWTPWKQCLQIFSVVSIVSVSLTVGIGLSAEAEVLQAFGAAIANDETGILIRTDDVTPTPDELLITVTQNGGDIGLDVANGKLYYLDPVAITINRANLDGSNPQTVVSELANAAGMGLDLANGKLYYGDPNNDRIRRSNLDGSSPETVVTGVDDPADIAIDAVNGKVYFADLPDGTLHRANLDGSNVELMAQGSPGLGPIAIVINHATSSVYWTDLDGIMRTGFDGTNFGPVFEPSSVALSVAVGLTLDAAEGKLYFNNFGGGVNIGLYRINLDGTEFEKIYDSPNQEFALALDTTNDFMYWSEFTLGGIRRKSIPQVDVIATGLLTAGGLEVSGNQLYYIDTDVFTFQTGISSIHRSNFDGSGDVTLLSNLSLPITLAIDAAGGKMYWTDILDGIQRANLDGSNVETIVPGTGLPVGIALDLVNSKVYWTTVGAPISVQRANLDGSNPEPVVEAEVPFGVAIHPGLNKVYWIEQNGSNAGINRANLDGTNPELVVTAPYIEDPVHVELDPASGKMYWSDNEYFYRANVDGTDVEVIQTGTFEAGQIALVTQGSSEVFVDFAFDGPGHGTESNPFSTVQEALFGVLTGGTIIFAGDSTDTQSSETPTITQTMTLNSSGGTVRIGDSD